MCSTIIQKKNTKLKYLFKSILICWVYFNRFFEIYCNIQIEIENVKTYKEYVDDKYSIELLELDLLNKDKFVLSLTAP